MGYTIRHDHTHVVNKDYRDFVILNKSNHSYSLNNKITAIFNSNSWLNKKCFIVGGGESLKGFDFSSLSKELTIGINKAFLHFNPIINYAMDSDLYDGMHLKRHDKHDGVDVWKKWLESPSIKIFLTPMEIKEFGKEVYLVRRKMEIFLNKQNLDEGIYGGRNSGLGAISLAVALGATTIFLLGYDMQAKTQSHWHKGYPNRDLVDFNRKLEGYREEITSFKKLLDMQNIQVYNCNSSSSLTCFPFVNLEKILGVKNVPNI